jgi:hypothetical protein
MLVVLRPFNEVDGGLGNYLFHLCHSVLYAKAREATLLIPRPLAYRTMNERAVALDFSATPTPDYRRPPWWDGRRDIERVPRSYDPEKIEVIRGLLHGNELTRGLRFEEHYRCMQEQVGPLFDPAAAHRALEDDTLAIHIRSGDIFDPDPNPRYGQPPLSWCELLIERGGFGRVVVIAQTEFAVGRANPVVTELRRRWPQVEVISQSPEHDFHTLRHARHLALSVSTFAVAAAMLNSRLETLHVPRYDRVADHNLSNIFPQNVDLGFTRYDYSIGRYDGMRSWSCSPEQIRLLCEHSIDDISVSREISKSRTQAKCWQPPKVRSVGLP